MKKFKHNKNYGQVFLKDKNIIKNIISELNINKNDLIVEIGAGTGALTKELKNLGSNLIAYEIDLRTKPYLDELKIKVIYDDFLKRNITDDIQTIKHNNLYVVGNLPYYITTRIIKKVIEETNAKEMILMVQKEVAYRLTAKPGTKDYGFISVFLNYYYDSKLLFTVNKASFNPIPRVDSAVIKLTLHNKYNKKTEKKFLNIIKDSFKHKRKTLLNNLKDYDVTKIKEILIANDISVNARAENIPIEVFLELAENI